MTADTLTFTWPLCNCHVADGHRKLIAMAGEDCLLSICQNALWLLQASRRAPGSPVGGPRVYAWEFHLAEPSPEWRAALAAMED